MPVSREFSELRELRRIETLSLEKQGLEHARQRPRRDSLVVERTIDYAPQCVDVHCLEWDFAEGTLVGGTAALDTQ